jgi:hypothetical protein
MGMSGARAGGGTINDRRHTTEFQLRSLDGSLGDLTLRRLRRYVTGLRDPQARHDAAELVRRYAVGTIVVGWRAGRPVYREVLGTGGC